LRKLISNICLLTSPINRGPYLSSNYTKTSWVHVLTQSLSNLPTLLQNQVTIEFWDGKHFHSNQLFQHFINIIPELIKHSHMIQNLRITKSLFKLEVIAAGVAVKVLDHFSWFQASKHTTGGPLKLSKASQHFWKSSTSKPDSILQEVSLKTQTLWFMHIFSSYLFAICSCDYVECFPSIN